MTVLRAFAVLAALGLLLFFTAAEAKPRPVKSRRSEIAPKVLDRLLERGELALIESDGRGRSRQVVVFAAVKAPPTKVYDALVDVEKYPQFMQSIVEANVVQRRGDDLFSFDWELNVPVFNLEGRRALRGRRPYVVEVRGVSGHFRDARERWELFPLDGGKRTLLALYRSLVVTHGGVILKTMVDLEPSMDHGINIATGFVNVRDLTRHVEGLAKAKPGTHSGKLPEFIPVFEESDPKLLSELQGLLQHGELALIESHADGSLRQVTVLARVEATRDAIVKIAHAPGKYPEFVPNLVEQKVTKEPKGSLRLEYEIEVPLANLNGVNRMTVGAEDSIDVVALSGDVSRGKWRWEFKGVEDGVTVPVHYAYTDVRESSWFVKKLVERQPLFEHGVVATASTIAVRALKARAEGKR